MLTIQEILCPFGITRCYKGYRHVCHSIQLALDDDLRMLSVTKEIYKETADYFHCNWTAVERNIRTVVERAWRVNPDLLIHMAGYPLDNQPTASEFIEIITSYIERMSA